MNEKVQKFIRYNQTIEFKPAAQSEVDFLIREHQAALAYPGDNFMPSLATQGEAYLILSPAEKAPLGVFVVKDKVHLGLAYIRPPYQYLTREIMEQFLEQFNIHYGFVASFDHQTIQLYLEFIQRSELQAYQFQLLHPDLLPKALPQIKLQLAKPGDVAYMDSMAFLTNSSAYIRRQEAWIARNEKDQPVGIGVLLPQIANDAYLDIGMFVNPDARELGIGRSIAIRLMEVVLKVGRIPVAGCFYKNFEARRTLESAGMTCIGTIFRFSFNKDRFK